MESTLNPVETLLVCVNSETYEEACERADMFYKQRVRAYYTLLEKKCIRNMYRDYYFQYKYQFDKDAFNKDVGNFNKMFSLDSLNSLATPSDQIEPIQEIKKRPDINELMKLLNNLIPSS